MASSLHASSVVLSSSSSCSKRIDAAIRISKPSNVRFQDSLKNESAVRNSTDGRLLINTGDAYTDVQLISTVIDETRRSDTCSLATDRMHLLLEAVADRVEMHRNIGEQRDNWNTLLLNSINMMTLTASTMAGIAAATSQGGVAVTASSALLFGAATGLLLIMNKIQPSQLAEEQRNATRLFKQLEREIQFKLAHRLLRQADVEEMTEKVLALDQAYPLPLLGKMLEKFPKTFEPAVWWPKSRKLGSKKRPSSKQLSGDRKEDERSNNGWSKDLEEEMRAIVDVLKSKDEEDYLRLGNIALKVNKVLAISGPLLTGVAAASSAFSGSSGALAAVAASAGALAAAVNTFEHGGQVGMVLEMYRNCAGFFSLLSESIESTLAEKDLEKRENGELFERKVAIKLGRSLSELRDLARKSVYSAIEGSEIDEFGSKLF